MSVADTGDIGRAYWTQYTAVMLIILTFVIGSFSRATHAREVERTAKVVSSPQDFGAITINSATELSTFESVAQVLKQHDINATLTCSGAEVSCDSLLSNALARLGEYNLPPDALLSEWVASSGPASLKLRFVRAQ